MVLESIHEQDFCDGSYGFRPSRSAHQALESLWTQTMKTGGGWILEVDIRSYPESGSPQGGVVSPILANVFLHYVLDEWFAQEVQPRLKGRTDRLPSSIGYLVRSYAATTPTTGSRATALC